MRRSEQARMLIGLSFPGSGPAVGSVAATGVSRSSRRGWLMAGRMLTRIQSWSREHVLEWDHVAYWSVLLACSALSGLVVGGYVGFMENATPHSEPPYSFTQLAASDVGWA